MVALAIDYATPPTGHPYEYIAECCERILTIDGKEVRLYLMLYGAYNAYGLIGPEFNGLAILNDTRKMVVLDGAFAEGYGWYPGNGRPSERQLKAFNALAILPDALLIEWIKEHQFFRAGSL
jgi:hypothetical protein